MANSGNANCYTGDQGVSDAEAMASLVAAELKIPPEEVLVASTGVIGAPLPMEKIALRLFWRPIFPKMASMPFHRPS